jgi:hypothetical protein
MQVLVSGKDMKYLHIVCECHAVVSLTHGGTFKIFAAALFSIRGLHVMDVTFELCDLQQIKHPLPVFEIIAV